jgi:O-antigen ligase
MAAAGADSRGQSGAAMSGAAIFSTAAIGLMFTLPFLQPLHRHPLTSFYSEWLALALGLAALVPLAGRQWWRELAFPVTGFFLVAFCALLAIQQALGLVPYAGQTLIAMLYLAWAVLLMFLGATLRREIGLDVLAAALAWFLLAGGILGALIGVLQRYEMAAALGPLVVSKVGKVAYGNLAQPNHFAAYTTLALAALVYLHASGRLRLALAVAPAALLLFALGFSGSRSVWGYLAILLTLALLRARRADTDSRGPAIWMIALIVGFVAAQWLATITWSNVAPGSGEVVTSAQRLFADAPAQGFRAQLMQVAWWMFLQGPLAGVGWGQFPWHDFSYRALADGAGIWGWPHNHAHNIVLHLLAETGLIGAAFIVGAGVYWLWAQRRAAFDLSRWWLLAVLGVLGAHSMVELPMWYAHFLGIAAVALGAGSERNFTILPGPRVSMAVLALLAAGAIPLYSVQYAYRDFERLYARDGTAPVGPERAAILSRAHRETVLRPYVEIALTFGIDVDRNRLRDKLELNGRVLRFAPIEVVAFRQAQLLALAGERDAARRQFAQAARVYPAEAPAAADAVRALSARHPAEMAPLLELAAEILSEQRAARETR